MLVDRTPRPEGRTARPLNTAGPSGASRHARRTPRRSEDRLDIPRACVQAPGPFRRRRPHIDTPRGASVKEANTSRPCGPFDRHRDRQTAPKSYQPDPLPASRSKELIEAKLSPGHPAPKSDMAKIEPSFELRGNDHGRLATAVRLRRAIRQHAPLAHVPRASVGPPRSRLATPKGRSASPRRPSGRSESAVLGLRAASRFRRTSQRGAAGLGALG